MVTVRKNFSGGGVAAVTMLLFVAVAVCTAEQAQVEDVYVRLVIVNSFPGPTQFNCYSNTQNRGTYTAAPNEYYYFGFNPLRHQFWDCVVVATMSSQPARTGTFRFWADPTHGVPQIDDSCGNYCNWQVDIFGVEQFVGGKWSLKYHWDTSAV